MDDISREKVQAVFLVVQLEDGELYQVAETQENMFKSLKKYTGRSKKLTVFDKPLPIEIKEEKDE